MKKHEKTLKSSGLTVCKNCSQSIIGNVKFCKICGHRVSRAKVLKKVVKSRSDKCSSCEIKIDMEFLREEPLKEWQKWISTLLNREFSWDRLEFMANRIAKGNSQHPAVGLAKDFIADPAGGVDDILERLPNGILEEFSNRSLENIDKALKEFTL